MVKKKTKDMDLKELKQAVQNIINYLNEWGSPLKTTLTLQDNKQRKETMQKISEDLNKLDEVGE